MATKRFWHLPAEKQTRILDSAAQLFAEHGYRRASITRAFERAGISKGAGYYYFEDRDDLYLTTVEWCFARLDIPGLISSHLKEAGADTFWDAVERVTALPIIRNLETPWRLTVLKTVGEFGAEHPDNARLTALRRTGSSLARSVFERGRELGVVRDDLPMEYLVTQFEAMNDATDRYILSSTEYPEAPMVERYIAESVRAIRALAQGRSRDG
jgi:AcrR family transcriptional regulator